MAEPSLGGRREQEPRGAWPGGCCWSREHPRTPGAHILAGQVRQTNEHLHWKWIQGHVPENPIGRARCVRALGRFSAFSLAQGWEFSEKEQDLRRGGEGASRSLLREDGEAPGGMQAMRIKLQSSHIDKCERFGRRESRKVQACGGN